MAHSFVIRPKADAEAAESVSGGRYARGVRHTEQRVRFRTPVGLLTMTMSLPYEDQDIEITLSKADCQPIRRR